MVPLILYTEENFSLLKFVWSTVILKISLIQLQITCYVTNTVLLKMYYMPGVMLRTSCV